MAAPIERDRVSRVRAVVALICFVGTVVSGCSSRPAGDVPGSPSSATLTLPASTSDLTPAHETKVADRIDGTTSFGYTPVTSRPATIPTPSDPPSASVTSTR